MAKKVTSIKHNTDTRAHIPSKEEAGYEDASSKVQSGKKILELPKNPIVHRGQDPELFWLNKYGNDDREALLKIDIRSLYRHEHVAPETLIRNLYTVTETQSDQLDLFSSVNELFGNALEKDEIDKVSEYYQHQDGWTNRLIQGDSHLVMASLLEREGMAGQVQTIFIDPPYGIKYGGNWQIKLNSTDVKDTNDEALTGEPEQIKAFRDTWELGIHSYLSYLRDRLLVAKELLTESGSCFVQISDENVHLVRSLMDEVFGSENFVSLIVFTKTGGASSNLLGTVNDYIIWFSKSKSVVKYRQLYQGKEAGQEGATGYTLIENIRSGEWRSMTKDEKERPLEISKDYKIFDGTPLMSTGESSKGNLPFEFMGKEYLPPSGSHWKTSVTGLKKLAELQRIIAIGNRIEYKRYLDDFPVVPYSNIWLGLGERGFTGEKLYVVQTAVEAIKRCILMTTDPGDLILDPTCGSGTTAFVAEQWGRRWITIDTSRIALSIAKERLMTAIYPYYNLYDENGDVRQGFIYKTVPHITLKSLANDEPTANETLYDQPEIDKKLLRVSGPFTVETLQNFEPISPEELDDEVRVNEEEGAFEDVIKQHLVSAGIKNGRKDEMVVFRSVELLASESLNAEGFYITESGEQKAYFHIGPKFGTVSKKLVNEAIKDCRSRGDAQWLVILGFSFESDIEGGSQTMSMGTFQVDRVRIHDDLLQEGLKKKPAKSAASFVTIGEPDIDLNRNGNEATIEIKGLDIYDPIKDEVKPRNIHDIAYWMVDEDYDGSNFVVKQVFFCGGDKDEFNKWKKGLDNLAKESTKKKVEKTLKIEIDDEAFDRLYGHISHPIEIKRKGQKVAVRIISQFGEECTKVLLT
ncbi:site-specific DNA-methyltransferase [Dyadobacter subterraneus]|uniref:site-specific DNA-methyltransferase (adenine-specific) n=1 Tax=Dyadobacter subterraneus TaxID=2773304 RepID=A0ABR9WH47_9BACT|nr:site-specific DNA-methyltransferase [Dyadobacter subterraneus]MBE9464703.1 site-specific DNA-methyltransferase [Dyadobacter subterraneus]